VNFYRTILYSFIYFYWLDGCTKSGYTCCAKNLKQDKNGNYINGCWPSKECEGKPTGTNCITIDLSKYDDD
jgi:hypothetical protein